MHAIEAELERRDWLGFERRESPAAHLDRILAVHARSHVDAVRELSARGGAFDLDTPTSSGSWEAALHAAGGSCALVEALLGGDASCGMSALRPPGHHAETARAMGFCLFGNVALAAHYARRRHEAERVLIVDWDVHHGNGTQALVDREPHIHFVSMHQWPWYPGTGPAEDRGVMNNVWNIPMPAALPPERYVSAFQRGVEAATDGFTPDLVLISSGFDSLRGDPLGGFTLENEHVRQLTRFVVEHAETWCAGRVVSALEGGYNTDRLGEACSVHMESLQ
jgi:acetoin utilization deacetylase AcuC-like enzyme